MAKYTDVTRYINDKKDAIDRARKDIRRQMASDTARAIGEATRDVEGVGVKQQDNKVAVTVEEESSSGPTDVIDLKQYFKQSPNRKETIGGGWHMVVPIRRYTGRSEEVREKASGMTSRLYKDLLTTPASEGYTNILSDYLYDNRRSTGPIPELNYEPKSKNITRMPKKGRGHSYVSFRTVSDKSHPASWVLNRDKTEPNQRTPEVIRIIEEVKRRQF